MTNEDFREILAQEYEKARRAPGTIWLSSDAETADNIRSGKWASTVPINVALAAMTRLATVPSMQTEKGNADG